MFYFPLRLRDTKEPCTPRGPTFKSAKRYKIFFNDTEVRFRMPRHRSPYEEAFKPSHYYDLIPYIFKFSNSNKNNWYYFSFLGREWVFYGPWFTGRQGSIDVLSYITYPATLSEDLSFFHPRVFENLVADYLSLTYKDDAYNGKQRWFAPVNWRPLENFPCVAVTFDVMANRNAANSRQQEKFLVFPISERKLCIFRFSLSWNIFFDENDKPHPDQEKWIDISEMTKLADDVINSFQVTLSPEAKIQQEKALEGLTDRALVREFPPLKWGSEEGSSTSISLTDS